MLGEIEAALPAVSPGRAGLRLFGFDPLSDWVEMDGVIGRVAASCLPRARAVRAILFDKSAGANWAVGWHQDRTISVADRHEVEGFGPWTVKQGVHHIAPPLELLSRMITLRVHLDDVGADNAPLKIAAGSHLLGRIAEKDVEAAVCNCRIETCLAAAGDVWVYATPILHASEPASKPSRRRVLQVDYSADSLPDGLRWVGI